ncbi:dehydrogenase [Xylophilus rhododendri]|uniref:Dehydrogenase n=1 Tax=Xylophilus rhododendri TaxID=2697032 RepID=A0A857J382_9BURK|nr:GMC family oxidoreductase [Xylophilus rhododendri]QHI97512.1 dehydrogenase [Xylophilus rhododendri]
MHHDIIVIGSGPGGASLVRSLAPTGKKILLIERGNYLPRSQANWDPRTVFVEGAYQAKETWHGADGSTFHPGLHYYVGGNSKVYGAALLRMREQDFGEVLHADGVSPAWPLPYEAFEPWYAQAEALFQVHGQAGEDPLEPRRSGPFPHPAVAHESRIETLAESLRRQGAHPFHLPLGILLDEKDGQPTPTSRCIRCDAFDGFPCLLNGKADAQVICVDPTLAAWPNVTLMTDAYAETVETDASGRSATAVHVLFGGTGPMRGQRERLTADIIVLACGALSTALLLQRSASERHPKGLANGSDQVGRNYMRHNQSVLMALAREPNDTVFQKTLAVSDYYFGDAGDKDWRYPLGLIQMCAKTHPAQIRGEELPAWLEKWLPDLPFDALARHSMDFWLSSEDLPRPENRIQLRSDGSVLLDVHQNNMQAHRKLRAKLEELLKHCDVHPHLLERELYFGKDIPIGGTAHQCGTARFGRDPASSVLDLDCKAHELDNLYVTDASFFVSSAAVNPTLTIVANALRVADHLKTRLGAAR